MSTNGDIDSGVLLPEFDLDLAQLDDDEFNIPKVEKIQTLEDILNEDETSLISEEELPNYLSQDLLLLNAEENCDAGSVSSVGSRSGHSPGYKKIPPSENILQHVILRAVSSKIQEAAEKTEGGWPSVVAVGGVIGVGTRHGLVLCFDISQRLRWTYDTPEEGSVTCLSLNSDSTRLLAGYARGLVLMFDSQDGRLLRSISPESHTSFTAVVHLKFTDCAGVALLSDSGGSVFELCLKRVLGVRSYDSKCIFSGSRGEVVAIEPLLLYNLPNHPLYGLVIVAMASLSKMMLVIVRPHVKVVLSEFTPSPPDTLPLLSWQCVIIKPPDKESRVMDPVLAVARHDTILFFQVSKDDSNGGVVCSRLQEVVLSFSLISCRWLSPRSLALVDTHEILHLFDVRSNTNLESVDISSVGLVYNSSAFKAIATGGNVSKAMALAGQRACYNSIQSSGNQLVVMGKKSVHVISIRFWADRVNNLMNQSRFVDALKLVMEFHEEKGSAVMGLRGRRTVRQKILMEKMLETLAKFVEHVLGSPEVVNYQEALPVIVVHCIDLNQRELLFDKLWNGLICNEEGKNAFLESMVVVILEGKITDVPPEVMQHLVSFLAANNKWKVIEDCVERVEVTSLDIEQVIMLCSDHQLFTGLISVWNRALADYTSPIHQLVPILHNRIKEGGNVKDVRELGNTLLVYVSSCLSGLCCYGRENAEQARQQVCRAICSQHSQRADDTETPFPYIRTLLEFDAKEFLNALTIAFSEPGLTLQMRQRLVDILIQVMTDDSSFKCTEIGMLLVMLSGAPGRGIRVEQELYSQTLDRLVSDTVTPHNDKEAALLSLVNADVCPPYKFKRDHLLDMAVGAGFHHVAAMLYEEKGDYGNVLKCHLLDPHWRLNVFSFIEHSPHKSYLSECIADNIQELVEINSVRTGQVVFHHFPDLIRIVLQHLSDEHKYGFLQGMLECGDLDQDLMTEYVCLMCKMEPNKVLQVVIDHDNIEISPALAVARECQLDQVSALLMERSGDMQGAFDLLLSRLNKSIENGEEVYNQTEDLVRLAQRGNAVLDSRTSWHPLLISLLQLKSHDILQRLLSNPELNLSSELYKLMQYMQGTLGEHRAFIMGLFVKCKQERQLHEALMNLHLTDLAYDLNQEVKAAQRGTLSPFICHICHSSFNSHVCLFRCGHGYHMECIQSRSKCIECFKVDENL